MTPGTPLESPSKADNQQVKIQFERSGGFAGIVVQTTLDTDDFNAQDAREWESMVEDARLSLPTGRAGRPGQPDRFEYWFRITGGGDTQEARIAESQLTEPQRALVHRLTEHARGFGPG